MCRIWGSINGGRKEASFFPLNSNGHLAPPSIMGMAASAVPELGRLTQAADVSQCHHIHYHFEISVAVRPDPVI